MNSTKGVIKYNLEPITRQEYDLLIKKGILKSVHGKIPGLITGSPEHHGRNKARWLEPPYYERLLKLQEKLKVENK